MEVVKYMNKKNMHLVIRCTYGLIIDNGNYIKLKETIKEHLGMINKMKATWWGITIKLNEKNIELLKNQIKNKINTYGFIYESAVPKTISIHGHRWFKAKIEDINTKTPNDRELIPSYYRNMNIFPMFLKFSSIEEIIYPRNKFPFLKSRISMRYVIFGKDDKPEHLHNYWIPDKNIQFIGQNK